LERGVLKGLPRRAFQKTMKKIYLLGALVLGVFTRDAVGRVGVILNDPTVGTSCGDGVCDASESCSTCAQDCGRWIEHGRIWECPGEPMALVSR
jgi:hypothetical protein